MALIAAAPDPRRTVYAILWMVAAGGVTALLNAMLKRLAIDISPFVAMALVYTVSAVVLSPVIVRRRQCLHVGRRPGMQIVRGVCHWVGVCLWFYSLPHLTLAQTIAIGYISPILVMLGACLWLGESWKWGKWLGAIGGLLGVALIVWPALSLGSPLYIVLMSASALFFAVSFLFAKTLTRTEHPLSLVWWQAVVVGGLSIPFLASTSPSLVIEHFLPALAAALLMLLSNYCFAQAFTLADISESQPAKFLDLIWAICIGAVFFGDQLGLNTVFGACVILAAFLAGNLLRKA